MASRCSRLFSALLATAIVWQPISVSAEHDPAEVPTEVPVPVPDEAPVEVADEAIHPLTGIAADELLDRSALAVKIDNARGARPQSGLSLADLVIEEKVEGGMSRYIAVFHSHDVDLLGPVRSARTSDFHILANLNRPLFGNSGGNERVLDQLDSAPLVSVNALDQANAYFRTERRSPHNLYTRTASLWAATPDDNEPPPQLFAYRIEGASLAPSARPVTSVSFDYGTIDGEFTWDVTLGAWRRSTDGTEQAEAATGESLATENVIVHFTEYAPSSADARSPEAVVTGTGAAWVFTDGHLVEGTWHRESDDAITAYLDADDQPIALTPGRTWIVLPEPGNASHH